MFRSQTYIISIFFSILALTGCVTIPQQIDIDTAMTLKDVCEFYKIDWSWDSVSQVVTLKSGEQEAKGLIGSDIVIFGAEKVYLSGPIRRGRDSIRVPDDFAERVIRRFGREITPKIIKQPKIQKIEPIVQKKSYKIVVDAGHGGKDPGAIGRSGLYEKDVVLDIAQRVSTKLKAEGFDITMTRDHDIFIPLEERTEIATRSQADLFLSIHANANPSRKVQGFEVYTLRELGKKERTEEQRKKNHSILFDQLSMKKSDKNLEKIVEDMLYTHKRSETPRVALEISRGTVKLTKAKNRGMLPSGFFVVRNNLMPAVLVEVGYLSNAREEKLLKADSYREKIAQGLVESILTYTKN